MRTRIRRAIAAAVFCVPLPACTTWQSRPGTDAASLADARVSAQNPLRIRLRDGRVLTLTALEISGDSLIGVRGDPRRGDARVAVALADVRAVADRQVDAGRTRELIAAIAGVAAALALAFFLAVAYVSI